MTTTKKILLTCGGPPQAFWMQDFDDNAGFDLYHGITSDSKKNVITCGIHSNEFYNQLVFFISKYDSKGAVIWQVQFEENGMVAYNVTCDSDDNIYVVGQASGGGFDAEDAVIIKLDADGNKLAGRKIGGLYADRFYKVRLDGSGNVICAGTMVDSSTNGLLAKYTSTVGSLTWQKRITTNTPNVSESIVGLAADSSDNIYICGQSDGAGYVAGLTSSGNISWCKNISATGDVYDPRGAALDTSENNLYVVGTTDTNDYLFVAKMSVSNPSTFSWVKHYTNSGETFIGPAHVAVDGDDNVFVVTYVDNDTTGVGTSYLLKLQSDGTEVYQKSFVGKIIITTATAADVTDVSIDNFGNVLLSFRYYGYTTYGYRSLAIKIPNNGEIDITSNYFTFGNSSLSTASQSPTLSNNTAISSQTLSLTNETIDNVPYNTADLLIPVSNTLTTLT